MKTADTTAANRTVASEHSKQVIITGAGVAGITAAIYAARNGHTVDVYERHAIPGGLSASWKRKGYFFECGMHWLAGSTPKLPAYKIWKETGALSENNPLEFSDLVFTYIHGDKRLNMWRKADRIEQELIAFAPEDKRAIKRFCRDIRIWSRVVGKPMSVKETFVRILWAVPFLVIAIRQYFMSVEQYLSAFSNADVRSMLSGKINTEFNAVFLLYTQCGYDLGDNGFPAGGSMRMVQNMVNTAQSFGVQFHYRSQVEKVVVEGGAVRGIQLNGQRVPADDVIVAIDTHVAIDRLFDQSIHEPWAERMRKNTVPESCMFLSLGVKTDLSALPENLRIKLDKALIVAEQSIDLLWVQNFPWSKGYAPEGCTALTLLMIGDSYDWWKAAREDGSYERKKQEVTEVLVETLSRHLPEIAGKVEVTDLATPLTFERYCGTYRGSWMTVWEAGMRPAVVPPKCKTIKGLHFCGQRALATGGLPIAARTARRAAMAID